MSFWESRRPRKRGKIVFSVWFPSTGGLSQITRPPTNQHSRHPALPPPGTPATRHSRPTSAAGMSTLPGCLRRVLGDCEHPRLGEKNPRSPTSSAYPMGKKTAARVCFFFFLRRLERDPRQTKGRRTQAIHREVTTHGCSQNENGPSKVLVSSWFPFTHQTPLHAPVVAAPRPEHRCGWLGPR